MNLSRISRLCLLTALAALGTGFGLDKVLAVPPRPTAAEQGTEVLTRGPVHEAFAGVITANPEPGRIVDTAPPTPIEEVPPDQRPVGENVTNVFVGTASQRVLCAASDQSGEFTV